MRRRVARALGLAAVLLFTLLAPTAFAVEPDEMLNDPALEARARALSAELRCLVCQNQSIDESDAPLAKDLRVLVRERLQAGDGDAQVREFLVRRYGDFVLLRPRFSLANLVLWLTPLIAVLAGAALLFGRRRATAAPLGRLTPEEERRLADLLEREG